MGFWMYMFICVLFVPLLMIITGIIFQKRPPKDINYILGYRTSRSTKNEETWKFAQAHFSKLWLRAGLIILPLSAVIMLFTLGRSEDFTGTVSVVITLIQTALLIILIFPTESALKKNFDEDGNRK